METADTLGNSNEWLVPATDIPMLVEKVTHFICEVPTIVTSSTDPLVVTFTIDNQEFELVLR